MKNKKICKIIPILLFNLLIVFNIAFSNKLNKKFSKSNKEQNIGQRMLNSISNVFYGLADNSITPLINDISGYINSVTKSEYSSNSKDNAFYKNVESRLNKINDNRIKDNKYFDNNKACLEINKLLNEYDKKNQTYKMFFFFNNDLYNKLKTSLNCSFNNFQKFKNDINNVLQYSNNFQRSYNNEKGYYNNNSYNYNYQNTNNYYNNNNDYNNPSQTNRNSNRSYNIFDSNNNNYDTYNRQSTQIIRPY